MDSSLRLEGLVMAFVASEGGNSYLNSMMLAGIADPHLLGSFAFLQWLTKKH